MPTAPGSIELNQASAELITQFLTDKQWLQFAENYAVKIRAKHPESGEKEGIPLLFVSQVTNSLRTEAGNPLNYSNITDKVLPALTSSSQLDRFIRLELIPQYPRLYDELKRAYGDWKGPEPLQRIRVSKYIGIEAETAVKSIKYILTDPRTDKKNIKEGCIPIPALALSFKMEPFGSTRIKITATITDFLKNDGTYGDGEVVWNGYVEVEKQ